MKPKYQNIQWVVQRNLTSQADFEALKKSCLKIGVKFIEVDIIPFTGKLPDFERGRSSIIYGSTTFNSLAYEDISLRKGLFFDESSFLIENYLARWGRHMLNYEALVISFKELIEGNIYDSDKLLFIRPNDDSKSFAGEVKRFDEIEKWYDKLREVQNSSLSLESKIIVSEPYNIHYEWRLWIVKQKVIAASKYREYFKLSKTEGCPSDVISFAEKRCQEYTPHDVFVMDICLCGDEYFIVECGCMNGAGFYEANVQNIVNEISDYFVTLLQ